MTLANRCENMSKRNAGVRDFYNARKRLRTGQGSQPWVENEVISLNPDALPSDTESSLVYLKNMFPVEKFDAKLPPVILVHQIYSIVKCRTTVDKDIRSLQSKGVIRLFKLGGEETALVVIFTEDLKKHIQCNCPSKSVISTFINVILSDSQDIAIDKFALLRNYSLSETCISDLMSCGLLVLRSVASFWFSFPNAGEFMRTYLKGRKSVIRTIKKCKFSEILQPELEQRKLEKSAKLGMKYHIHDIIGADLVQCIETTSGTILRLKRE